MSLTWHPVCDESDLKPGEAASAMIAGKMRAVFNVNGVLYGMEALCLHMQANLASGTLYDHILECAMHGWEYDVRTGECLTDLGSELETYPAKFEAGQAWLGIET